MRLIIVSNRLPYTILKQLDTYTHKLSDGGLSSAMRSFFNEANTDKSVKDYLWLGWNGISFEENHVDLDSKLAQQFSSHSVSLKASEVDNFYYGFTNKVIWPLFHNFVELTQNSDEFWDSYKKINQKFRDEIAKILRAGDVIWIHDYHFMLLPKLIKTNFAHIPVGFFLHIPFPKPKIFSTLKEDQQRELLEGIIAADSVGFQTEEYAQNFKNTLDKVFTRKVSPKIGTFPIGIDFEKFNQASRSPKVLSQASNLKISFAGKKIILAVERLDYKNGIINKLKAFYQFARKNPRMAKKVKFILLIVPSREKIEAYQKTKSKLKHWVNLINRSFKSVGSLIDLRYTSVDFATLVSLYKASDLALVTPIVDGMNLVAKEFIASKVVGCDLGSLVLSKFAGAANELKTAIQIDPNNISEIAEAIKIGLELDEREQARRILSMQKIIKENNVHTWVNSYLAQLNTTKEIVEVSPNFNILDFLIPKAQVNPPALSKLS